MPSVSHAVGNLYHSIAEILGGLLNSIMAVFQSIVALATNTVQAFFAILRALFTGLVDLMSSAVGFVIGASTVHASSFPLQLVIYSSCACRQHLHSYCPWCCVLVLRDANAARTGDSSKRPGEVEGLNSHWQCRIMSIMSIISIIIMSSNGRILNLVRIDSSDEALFGPWFDRLRTITWIPPSPDFSPQLGCTSQSRPSLFRQLKLKPCRHCRSSPASAPPLKPIWKGLRSGPPNAARQTTPGLSPGLITLNASPRLHQGSRSAPTSSPGPFPA